MYHTTFRTICIIYVYNRHLRVMLTNVLWTDLGRKFRKTLPRNDANLCDTSKVQSESLPSTSVDSVETCQKLDPLHQSLNLSERYVIWYWFCSIYSMWNSINPYSWKQGCWKWCWRLMLPSTLYSRTSLSFPLRFSVKWWFCTLLKGLTRYSKRFLIPFNLSALWLLHVL